MKDLLKGCMCRCSVITRKALVWIQQNFFLYFSHALLKFNDCHGLFAEVGSLLYLVENTFITR